MAVMSTDTVRGRGDKPTPSLEDGEALARQLMPLLKFAEERSENPVHWWAGFIGVIAGSCGGSIGPEAADVLGRAFQGIVAEIARQKAN
jgi:hypothetical protein